MSFDLLEKIAGSYDLYTKSEAIVADFILENPKRLLSVSISEMAELCGVGDATVYRFCRTLNLKGYQEFRMYLAQSTVKDMAYVGEIEKDDSLSDVCKKIVSANNQVLNETMELLNIPDIEKTVKMLREARGILIIGSGSSGVSAMDAMSKIIRIRNNVDYYSDPHIHAMKASLMNEQDLVIAISYSGSSKDVIETMSIARANGCGTVCITRYPKSPLTAYADIVLLCASNEGPLQGGSLSTKIAQLFLIDLLYVELLRSSYDIFKGNRTKTTEAIASKLL